jgi:hypothetical protein
VELRAGKEHLKERWGITTWADLDAKLGDVFAHALDAIRYAEPGGDSNRSRWQDSELWRDVRAVVSGVLFEMQSGALPGVVKEVRRVQLAQTMRAMILGLAATWALATGTPANASAVPAAMAEMAKQHIQDSQGDFIKKVK